MSSFWDALWDVFRGIRGTVVCYTVGKKDGRHTGHVKGENLEAKMMTWLDAHGINERRQDLIHEAEMERLAKQALGHRQRPSIWQNVRNLLPRVWGNGLQPEERAGIGQSLCVAEDCL